MLFSYTQYKLAIMFTTAQFDYQLITSLENTHCCQSLIVTGCHAILVPGYYGEFEIRLLYNILIWR